MILDRTPAMTPLEGKVALVTGAGRGLGCGIAKAFLGAGSKVCVTDVDEAEMEASFQGMEDVREPVAQPASGCDRP